MRQPTLTFLLLLGACGGGSTPTQPPPPPSGQPGPPASVAIQAGDGQDAEPGRPLAVNPAVVVRDASGRAAPGIPVTFSVESGGGTVSAASANTGSDGVASVTWTLGASDGPALLQATVAGLPPVRFAATGKFPLVTLIDGGIVPPTGGTVAYTKQGDPLTGLKLTVPAGTFPDPTTFSIRTDRNVHPTLPADVKQVGPAFLVTNGKGFAAQPMALTLPVSVGGDSVLAAFFYDPATGTLEGVPMVGRDAGSITLATRHFSADQLMAPGGASSVRNAAPSVPAFGSIYFVVAATTPAALNAPIMSGFVPGTDDWEFHNYGTFLAPGGICAGMSVSAMYYYYRFRPLGRALHRQYDKFQTLEWDNPQGERFASMVQTGQNWSSAQSWLATVAAYARQSGISYDQLMYQTAAMTIKVTGQPQLMALLPPLPFTGGGHAVVAYGVNNGLVLYADPNQPGTAGLSARYGAGRFGVVNIATDASKPPINMQVVGLGGATALVSMRSVDAWWADFAAGRAGASDFPPLQRQMFDLDNNQWVDIPSNGVIQTTHRVMALRTLCPQCGPIRGTPPAKRTVTVMRDSLDVIWGADKSDPDTAAFIVFGRGPGSFRLSMESFYSKPSEYIDQTMVTIFSSPVVIAPGPATVPTGVDVTFTLEHNNLGGATAKFVWDFGDGTPKVTKTGDSTVTHHWNTIGDYTLTAEVQDAAGKKLGQDQTTVTVANGPFIRFAVAGPWDPVTTPANGNYGYANGDGARTPSPGGGGLDAVFLAYNVAPDSTIGVLVTMLVPAGHALTVGETFTQFVPGRLPLAGEWQLTLSQDQNDVEGSTQYAPKGTGTLRIDGLAKQPDGTFLAQYSFTITSPGGGTITGSGVGQWR